MDQNSLELRRNKIFDKKYILKSNGCWEWIGEKTKFGYGKTAFRKKGLEARMSAHRYSYERFKGKIPEDMHVCHNCPGGDNRLCVNPDHLWLGNSLENNRDKEKKGRQTKGQIHASAKLTEENVKEIHRRYIQGEFGTNLAKEFNVSNGLIYHIIKGRAWKHLINAHESKHQKKRNYPQKLTEKDILEIRKKYQNGVRVSDLSREYNVSTTMISRIKNGKAWKHLL